jgi:ParB-like chromosome segregation protein Spo0J
VVIGPVPRTGRPEPVAVHPDRAGLPGTRPVRVPIRMLREPDSPRLAGEDPDHVRLLADLDGPLPPIVVHRPTRCVIDGVHRLRAAQLRGEDTIEAEFADGSRADAFVLAVRLNTAQGLPLTRADRLAAAARITGTHPEWSDRRIAAATGLSPKTVAAARARSTAPVPQSNGRVGRDGRVRPLNPAAGRRRAAELIAHRPGASLRDIAADAGISVSTAKDVRERVRLGQDPVPQRLVRRAARPAAVHTAPALRPGESTGILHTLRRDPSLRFTNAGRTLLRLIDAHVAAQPEWARLADGVPGHCTEGVARIARQCAQAWLSFARRVESRDGGTAGTHESDDEKGWAHVRHIHHGK